jgi:hypothetical protein
MTRWIEGIISVLQCEVEGHLTPLLTLSGDTDMVTAGIASLSSVVANEIIVADLNASELGDPSGENFQNRINRLLRRGDLRLVQLRRTEATAGSAGSTFQAFQKTYAPPRLVFACPRCDADAVAIRTQTPTNYKRGGGMITVMADLEVRDCALE